MTRFTMVAISVLFINFFGFMMEAEAQPAFNPENFQHLDTSAKACWSKVGDSAPIGITTQDELGNEMAVLLFLRLNVAQTASQLYSVACSTNSIISCYQYAGCTVDDPVLVDTPYNNYLGIISYNGVMDRIFFEGNGPIEYSGQAIASYALNAGVFTLTKVGSSDSTWVSNMKIHDLGGTAYLFVEGLSSVEAQKLTSAGQLSTDADAWLETNVAMECGAPGYAADGAGGGTFIVSQYNSSTQRCTLRLASYNPATAAFTYTAGGTLTTLNGVGTSTRSGTPEVLGNSVVFVAYNHNITPSSEIWYSMVQPWCGDNTCNNGETSSTCIQDCPAGQVCGDGACTGTETLASCGEDCDICTDGTCGTSESTSSCPQDCPGCGDRICQSGETYLTCSEDCNPPADEDPDVSDVADGSDDVPDESDTVSPCEAQLAGKITVSGIRIENCREIVDTSLTTYRMDLSGVGSAALYHKQYGEPANMTVTMEEAGEAKLDCTLDETATESQWTCDIVVSGTHPYIAEEGHGVIFTAFGVSMSSVASKFEAVPRLLAGNEKVIDLRSAEGALTALWEDGTFLNFPDDNKWRRLSVDDKVEIPDVPEDIFPDTSPEQADGGDTFVDGTDTSAESAEDVPPQPKNPDDCGCRMNSGDQTERSLNWSIILALLFVVLLLRRQSNRDRAREMMAPVRIREKSRE